MVSEGPPVVRKYVVAATTASAMITTIRVEVLAKRVLRFCGYVGYLTFFILGIIFRILMIKFM